MFHIRQRVRVIANHTSEYPHGALVIGRPATVLGFRCGYVCVRTDEPVDGTDEWSCLPSELRPLEDPGFNAFMRGVVQPVPLDAPPCIEREREVA